MLFYFLSKNTIVCPPDPQPMSAKTSHLIENLKEELFKSVGFQAMMAAVSCLTEVGFLPHLKVVSPEIMSILAWSCLFFFHGRVGLLVLKLAYYPSLWVP